MHRRHLWFFFTLAWGLCAAAGAEPVASVSSPGGTLTVTITLNDEGRPGYAIARRGKPLIAESRLGFLLTDASKLERNFEMAESSTRSVDETWEQPWGERAISATYYNELRRPSPGRIALPASS